MRNALVTQLFSVFCKCIETSYLSEMLCKSHSLQMALFPFRMLS